MRMETDENDGDSDGDGEDENGSDGGHDGDDGSAGVDHEYRAGRAADVAEQSSRVEEFEVPVLPDPVPRSSRIDPLPRWAPPVETVSPVQETHERLPWERTIPEIEAALAGGDECYGVLGTSQSGKTTLMAVARLRHAKLTGVPFTEAEQELIYAIPSIDSVAPTQADDANLFSFGGRHFIDVAGEAFGKLMLNPEHAKDSYRFFQRWAKQCRGFVMMVDLVDIVAKENIQQQFDLFRDAVSFIRAAILDRIELSSAGLTRNNIWNIAKECPRIRAPFLILFSKADRLESVGWIRGTDERRYSLNPNPPNPTEFAMRNAEDIYNLMRMNVRHFKFDFVQSFRKEDRHLYPDDDIGVLPALDYITSTRPGRATLPTVDLMRFHQWFHKSHWKPVRL
ncbi:MAG: hypothetical protein IT350_07930 [Deltaproteobacteria bacterium]|nr:hypothetical protein [Deltaproteobacteria bacterium]